MSLQLRGVSTRDATREARGMHRRAPLGGNEWQVMPHVCIVAHAAYGAITGGVSGHIGGVERQTSMMAKWLAARGWAVSVITWNEGGPPEEFIDGVRIITTCRQDAGITGLRFLHPRWTSLYRVLRMADADVYYHNSAEYTTGQIAWWCRRRGRQFVYSVASEPACDRSLPLMRTVRERLLYHYGLSRANRIIVQTKTQKRMLWEGFGFDSIVLAMPCAAPCETEVRRVSANLEGKIRILWAGRVVALKRLELLLDVAARMPDVQFDVAGSDDTDYARLVLARARGLPNIVVHGKVPLDWMTDLYKRASCLVCTSSYEGFPNTFLEAWSHGLPVVSTFDPGGLIAERELGVVAHDLAGLVVGLRGLLESPERWQQLSKNAQCYYLENHRIDVAMPRFERVLADLARFKGT